MQKSNIHVIIAIRYSLFSSKLARSWKIGRNHSIEEYRSILFEKSRLEFRRHTFSNITLPSLMAAIQQASDINSEIHIITSESLPETEKRFLNSLSESYAALKIYYQNEEDVSVSKSTEEYISKLPNDAIIGSVRIDDDDALSNDFLVQLKKYLAPEFNGYTISLCGGYGGLLDNTGNITKIGTYKWRFASAGLTYVYIKSQVTTRKTIYDIGNHAITDDRTPTILDARQPSMIRMFHSTNDSSETFEKNIKECLSHIEIEKFNSTFSISKDLIKLA